ncbi:MAG: metallophosphoesterase family protein, partial [Thermodesulfobacteriota bacterium]|nr:metallophosphoesterase family protein [Thermodesulfobacteriota bacterium]
LKPGISPTGLAAYNWTRDRVSPDDRGFLLGLPTSLDLTVNGSSLTLAHGSPENVREYLYPDTPEEHLAGLLDSTGSDILLCGHTHKPMVRETRRGLVINPGSVGKPKDGDPRAAYLILSLEEDRVETDIRRVEYPVDKVAEAIRRAGLPKNMADSLKRGVSA